jgi:sugar phosphate isomerase/epimerase
MGYPSAFCQRAEHLRALLGAVEAPEFSLCWDGGNFTITQQDAVASLREFLPRVQHVHFKDGVRGDAGWKTVVLGNGIVPLTEMFGVLKDSGYSGYVSVEHSGDTDPWEEAERGIAYVRSLM